MIAFTHADSPEDIRQILDLQQQNLYSNISADELAREGFVTVAHDFDILSAMNEPYPHIVAKEKGRVVGYALVTLKDFKTQIPELIGLFAHLDQVAYQNRLLMEVPYFVMGQVCIAKGFRGQGLFGGLYRQMRKQMAGHFELVVTSVAKRNQRSVRAHEKVGFQILKQFQDELDDWVIVGWDWG